MTTQQPTKSGKVLNPDRWVIFYCLEISFSYGNIIGGDFFMKNTVTKYLIVINQRNSLEITAKEVSKYAPINRVLDKIGFYSLDSITIKNQTYLVTFSDSEIHTKKTKLLVAKVSREENKIIDMEKSDYQNLYEIASKLMNYCHLVS